MDAEYI